MAEHKNKLEYVRTELLENNEWNVQTQSESTFNRLREEIRKVGFIDPIQVIPKENPAPGKAKYLILGGEHRWRAAMAEGLEEVPVIILTDTKWNDVDLQKMVSIRVNILKGKIDNEKFAKLYNEMANKYGADALQSAFGFVDAKAFQTLLGSISKGLKDVVSKEQKKKFDEGAKEAKSVEELTSILNEMFSKNGDTIDQNFIVFTHGKKEHIYVSMDHKTKRSMEKVLEYCKMTRSDINDVMAPVIERAMKECEEKLADAYADPSDIEPGSNG